MYLKYIQVVNYKNLPSAKFEFRKGANTIIGENDAGKSNAMTALRILLDSGFYYNSKRLKESDFSDVLGDWKGHWIIISAFFDAITPDDKANEICAELTPSSENADFLKSYIRCQGYDYGVVTLFIRPVKSIRKALATASTKEEFDQVRAKIKLSDYEFYYTSRAQTDFTDISVYNAIVGDLSTGTYSDPDNADASILGTQRLINYYKQFEVHSTNAHSLAQIRDSHGRISFDNAIHKDTLAKRIADIVSLELSHGVPDKEICIAAPQWHMIFPLSRALRKLLPDIRFDSPDVSPFRYDRTNPFFLLAQLTFTEAGTHVASRKRIAAELLDILRTDYEITIPPHIDVYGILRIINSSVDPTKDGVDCLRTVVSKLFGHIGIKSCNERTLSAKYTAFLKKANQRIKDYNIAHTYNDLCAFFKEKEGVVISTLHGTKGEEYHTVIAFGLLKGYVPHWDIVINQPSIAHSETQKLLYVICSRAKENLYLFSETGHCTRGGSPYSITPELSSASCSYDIV